MLSLHPNKRG